MKTIVRAPNHVLTAPGKTVTKFDKRLVHLVADLKATLTQTKNPKGVGLAAPQIGEPWRVFVTRPKESDPIRAFVNPVIVKSSTELTDGMPDRGDAKRDNKLEGCLSIPKIWGKLNRAKRVTLNFQDEKGDAHEETFTDFVATIIQHETDHTNGILFPRRVLEQKGKLYQTAKDEEGKEVLEEIKLT